MLHPMLLARLPYVKAIIIGCADMRVDPEAILGLASGSSA
jgi:carbonic anhydrase